MDSYKEYQKELLQIESNLLERYPEQEEGIQLALAYALYEAKKHFNN